MRIGIGDAVFTRTGDPGVVKGRNTETGVLNLETNLGKVQEQMRHGYINGLTPEKREELYNILDKVKENKDPAARVQELGQKLTELEVDPRNHVLTRYVKAEMLFVMNAHNIRPTNFSVDEAKAR